MLHKHIKLISGIGLLLATIIWGSSFVVMKYSVETFPPGYLIAIRFTMAGLAGALVFAKKWRGLRKSDIYSGALAGFWLGVSYLLQNYGLKYTTASNNAFITTFYVIIVPFLCWVFNKDKIRAIHIVTAVIALCGIALLSLNNEGGSYVPRFGDVLTLGSSVTFAAHILVLARTAGKVDVFRLSVLQLLFAAAVLWIFAGIFETFPAPELFTPGLWLSLLYLAFFATLAAFVFQTLGAKHLPPMTVSILLSLECVFGAIFSIAILGDPLTGQIFAGFILMFAASVISIRNS
ncbi:MAG: DMT family transporter [Oscillospiraceae bacterium]|jgi:drug/metabolite transporter (DMT)-like permease|nr:DMT family transporter [Oscillospiraceae bacterium]